ncbi:SNF2 domain-containing protein CLASSY 1-like [Musa acuminata AAA Group]|uniref:SNF2 domain-containing protein CLASSY 1-like n=1 Tax=Musa acuminata AAA Group TaxID=214697 RepID=UPI0031DB7CFA
MSKRRLSHCNHPINGTPFEAYYHGSWHGVDHISIRNGSTFAKLNYHGTMIVDKVDGDCLRMRSRKASLSDCIHFLKPGVEVCVLSRHPVSANFGQEVQKPLLSWHDAIIISIKKVRHVDHCSFLFSVMICTNKSSVSEKKGRNDRWAEVVPIDNISILQKLQSEPCEDGYYQWNSTVDCVSYGKSKLLNEAFSSEVAWLLVLSTLKGMSFDLKLVQNKLVSFITKSYQESASLSNLQSDGATNITNSSSHETIKIMRFQWSNEILKPKIQTVVMAPSEEITPEKATEANHHVVNVESDSEVEFLYEHTSLRHSKRLKVVPDRFSSYSSPDFGRCTKKIVIEGINGTDETCIPFKSGVLLEGDLDYVELQQQKLLEGKSALLHSRHSSNLHEMTLIGLHKRGKDGSTDPSSNEIDHIPLHVYKRRFKRKKLANPNECKEVIEKCIGNIRNQIERQFEPIVPQAAYQPTASPKEEEEEDFNWTPLADTPAEQKEHEDLWKEMEHSLTTLALLEQKQAVNFESQTEGTFNSVEYGEEKCQHDYELHDEIGLRCRLCSFVCTEIKHVSPPFLQVDGWNSFKEKFVDQTLWIERYDLELNALGDAISSREISLSERCENVWSLIDDLQSKLHLHQKKAFEFIWKNTTGSLKPEEMNHLSENTGGCVISHSPGSGKTLLIIAFIVSYLRLFPKSRPLVLAPKSAIHTWSKEFQKWGISVPVYLIQRENKFRTSSFRTSMPSRKMRQIMDSVKKLQQWHENPSILLMNYSSFFALSKQYSKLEHIRFVAEVLQKSPGILILDEGHNPRSTKSKLRKLLMEVKTENRVLLSGTVFQNNFEEYFNTLALARPRFVDDVINELEPNMLNLFDRNKQKQAKTKIRKERLARKLFMEKVGQNIESNKEHDRKQGFGLLNKITGGFVDVYGSEILDMLPGLEIYTIMLASTELQHEMLMKLQNSVPHKRYPLELEILVTVCSIHPWLVKSVGCVTSFFSADELETISKCRENFRLGSKVNFVIDLVHKSDIRGEKVLVFCHNISPLNFLVDLFKLIFGWNKGEEVLVLQGDQELPLRAKIMDKFNGDVHGKCKVLLASTTACAEGISLTAASRLVMLDSEWNHSKTRQAIARAFRPGQEKVVYVYLLLASGTWEEGKYKSNARKAWMSKMIFLGRYIEFSSSRQVEHIDDELLRELVEEDEIKMLQMIMRPS